jgi:hypothetical protein
MTSPNPDDKPADNKPADNKPAAKPSAAPPVEVLAVVEFSHHDPILNREHRALGVVFEVGDGTAKVVPLAHHSVQVDVADVLPLSADDL